MQQGGEGGSGYTLSIIICNLFAQVHPHHVAVAVAAVAILALVTAVIALVVVVAVLGANC